VVINRPGPVHTGTPYISWVASPVTLSNASFRSDGAAALLKVSFVLRWRGQSDEQTDRYEHEQRNVYQKSRLHPSYRFSVETESVIAAHGSARTLAA